MPIVQTSSVLLDDPSRNDVGRGERGRSTTTGILRAKKKREKGRKLANDQVQRHKHFS